MDGIGNIEGTPTAIFGCLFALPSDGSWLGYGPYDISLGLTCRSGTLLVAAQNNATSYRADIDGLRGLSIVLVAGFHALPWLTRADSSASTSSS
jgi:hypothetical protein